MLLQSLNDEVILQSLSHIRQPVADCQCARVGRRSSCEGQGGSCHADRDTQWLLSLADDVHSMRMMILCHAYTFNPFHGSLSRSTLGEREHDKHSVTHYVYLWVLSSICNYITILTTPIASSLFSCRVRQSFSTVSLQVAFRLSLSHTIFT